MSTALTPDDVSSFIKSNCSNCIHYKGHAGAIVECANSFPVPQVDVLDWKKSEEAYAEKYNKEPSPAEKWHCAAKSQTNF